MITCFLFVCKNFADFWFVRKVAVFDFVALNYCAVLSGISNNKISEQAGRCGAEIYVMLPRRVGSGSPKGCSEGGAPPSFFILR